MSINSYNCNKKESDRDLYEYIVHEYFDDSLKNVKLDEKNIVGMQGLNDRIYEYIVSLNANLMIDEEEFNNRVYFYIAENIGWYNTHVCKYIYFYYDDKCYEIYLQYDKWDYKSGKFEVCGNVSIHDKSFLDLGSFDLHYYHDPDIRRIDYKDNVEDQYFEFLLEDGQNIISEIIKRFRNNKKERSRNNSNNKGM